MDRIEQAKVMLMQLVRSGLATLAELEQVPLEDLLGRRLVDRVVDANGRPENSTTAHLNRFSLSAAGQPFQNLPGAEMYLPTAVAGLLSVG